MDQVSIDLVFSFRPIRLSGQKIAFQAEIKEDHNHMVLWMTGMNMNLILLLDQAFVLVVVVVVPGSRVWPHTPDC